MKKPFLLTAGEHYYPSCGDGDWIGFFGTREEAEKQVIKLPKEHLYKYKIGKLMLDWYYISNIS